MDTDPLDVTDILAQPREFAQKLARVERERAELIETVSRLRAECNDAQAVARAYILRAERAEAKTVRLTELLSEAVIGVGYAVTFGAMVSKGETIDNCGDPDAVLYLLGEAQSIETRSRAALLGVKTTEGLTASEWLARTAKAEAEVARLTAALEAANRQIASVTEFRDRLHKSWFSSTEDELLAERIEKELSAALRQPAPATAKE